MECRDYLLPPEFPVVVLTGEEWRLSDQRSPVLHFHNHMEIGICHTDSGVMGFRDGDRPFRAGDVTLIAAGTPHTTCSAPGTASKWSYIMVDPIQLIDPATSTIEPPVAQMYAKVLYNFQAIVPAEQEPLLPSGGGQRAGQGREALPYLPGAAVCGAALYGRSADGRPGGGVQDEHLLFPPGL